MDSKKGDSKKRLKKGSFMRELLSGSMVSEKIILSNLGYISFVALLAASYIGSRFHAESLTREISRLQKEVQDLRAESLSTSADLMNVSKQSEVYRLVKIRGLDLEEMKSPPYKLLVDKK